MERALVLAFSRVSDVINFEDHLHYLSSQQDLLLLAKQCLNYMLLFHICIEPKMPFKNKICAYDDIIVTKPIIILNLMCNFKRATNNL